MSELTVLLAVIVVAVGVLAPLARRQLRREGTVTLTIVPNLDRFNEAMAAFARNGIAAADAARNLSRSLALIGETMRRTDLASVPADREEKP